MIVAGASAYPRIIDFERLGTIAKSVDALLMVDMAHIAGLVAAGEHPSPFPHADLVTTTTHKTLRGPRGGLVFSRADLGKQVDKTVFPGLQGGPLMHVIAAKAVALKLAATDEFRDDIEHTIQNAKVLATPGRQRRAGRLRRHGQPPDARRRDAARRDRQGGRGTPRRDRHHGQQERDPVRSAAAQHRVGHPRRHAGDDDAWLWRGRDARGGRADRRGHPAPRRRTREGSPARPRARHLRAVPRPRLDSRREPVGDRGPSGHPRRARARGTRQLPPHTARHPFCAAAGRDRRSQRRPASPRSTDPADRRPGGGGSVRCRRPGGNPGQRDSSISLPPFSAVRAPEVFALFMGVAVGAPDRLSRRPAAAPGPVAVHRPVRCSPASRWPAASASSGCPTRSPRPLCAFDTRSWARQRRSR